MDYLSPVFNETAYCLAIEKLLGITEDVPERASVIRVLMMELNRISSHMVALGTGALELGAMGPMFFAFREREMVLDAFEAITGLRMNMAYVRPGGVQQDLPAGMTTRLRELVKTLRKNFKDNEKLLVGNTIWMKRTVGIGYLDLAGGGLRDTTRIAASSAALWSEILSSNAPALRPLLLNLQNDLSALIEKLDEPTFVSAFIESGNRGRAMIPGKHGASSRSYSYLPVVIEDKPGQLAALFEECASAGVNVEDLTIEHSPEQFTGLITLALSSDDAKKLFDHLEKSGWKVHSPR
jgi:hypothetical protein